LLDGDLLLRIRQIWETARSQAARSVNSVHVAANWLIGQQIVEAEQGGTERAAYGMRLLESLSEQLEAEYGDGFSVSTLRYMRLFYIGYPELVQIHHAVRDESGLSPITADRDIGDEGRDSLGADVSSTAATITNVMRSISGADAWQSWKPGQIHPALSWTHYRTLLKVRRRDVRDFHEVETVRSGWSARQLERQINSLLFERLLKSRDKAGLLALANEGLVPNTPADVIKGPYVLEFLDLPESHRLVESRIEEALVTQLQEFLLELGSGFAFVGRQVCLTLDGDHFYPDLIFYHVKLKCYVVIDLKVGKLSHGDLGQMQLYVHYYDREVAESSDNPTIGLILCTDKNESMVRYVLDEQNRQIFASRYQFELPSEETLRIALEREMERLGPSASMQQSVRRHRHDIKVDGQHRSHWSAAISPGGASPCRRRCPHGWSG
jgi:predicted nuclease of restriction endonuclease-like (RecB) superfamily